MKKLLKFAISICVVVSIISVILIVNNKVQLSTIGSSGKIVGNYYEPFGYFGGEYSRPYPMLFLVFLFLSSVTVIAVGSLKLASMKKIEKRE